MKFKVHHRVCDDRNLNFRTEVGPETKFVHVANVETDGGKEKVFELTNHIDQPWWKNDGVEQIIPHGGRLHRSTSVGDVIEGEDGVAWLVDSCGYKLLAWWRARV